MNRQLLDQLPDDTLLPVSYVRQLLADMQVDDTEPLTDLDVKQVAAALGRKPSTVRAWLHAGELAGYKLAGREWRVRREDLRAFQDRQREKSTNSAKTFRRGREVDLSAWRKVRKAAT